MEFDSTNGDLRLMESLGECMGRRIETVKLSDCDAKPALNAVLTLVDGIQVKNLVITCDFSNEIASHIMAAIATHNIDHLELGVINFKASEPVATLLELSSHIRSLHITYCDPLGADDFFGINEDSWLKLILDIFSKKTDTLIIENCRNGRFLSARSVEFLCQRLPSFGKKISFKASCNTNCLSNTINNYLVKADATGSLGHRFLSVIHSSRKSARK
ncbi:hypothetical protein PENTCL1PPCAC_18870 [Pristionchus entomophagus]|uniref:Uncharacterized protein n=1 Tax=Pristionchus entomophagus TaxID=358040 RepID=A0AAV5TQH7_9BILA|nr:hypothetical protein PENTCL1PPCAC_18870 [Pristionchus entomophagus]